MEDKFPEFLFIKNKSIWKEGEYPFEDREKDSMKFCARCGMSNDETTLIEMDYKGSNEWICIDCRDELND